MYVDRSYYLWISFQDEMKSLMFLVVNCSGSFSLRFFSLGVQHSFSRIWLPPIPVQSENHNCVYLTSRYRLDSGFLCVSGKERMHRENKGSVAQIHILGCLSLSPNPAVLGTSITTDFIISWWISRKESACNAGDLGSIPGSGRFPWRRERLPTPVFLPGEFHGQKSLVGYSPWGCKELDTTEGFLLLLIIPTQYMFKSRFWEVHDIPRVSEDVSGRARIEFHSVCSPSLLHYSTTTRTLQYEGNELIVTTHSNGKND